MPFHKRKSGMIPPIPREQLQAELDRMAERTANDENREYGRTSQSAAGISEGLIPYETNLYPVDAARTEWELIGSFKRSDSEAGDPDTRRLATFTGSDTEAYEQAKNYREQRLMSDTWTYIHNRPRQPAEAESASEDSE